MIFHQCNFPSRWGDVWRGWSTPPKWRGWPSSPPAAGRGWACCSSPAPIRGEYCGHVTSSPPITGHHLLPKLETRLHVHTQTLLMCILSNSPNASYISYIYLCMPVQIPLGFQTLASWERRNSCWEGSLWWTAPRPPPTPSAPGWRSKDWSSPPPCPCLAGLGWVGLGWVGGRGNILFWEHKKTVHSIMGLNIRNNIYSAFTISLICLFSYCLPEWNQVYLNVLQCHPHHFANNCTCYIQEQDDGGHGSKCPKPRCWSHQLDQV